MKIFWAVTPFVSREQAESMVAKIDELGYLAGVVEPTEEMVSMYGRSKYSAKPRLVNLSPMLELVLLEGPKMHGTYKMHEALGDFEERMVPREIEVMERFLAWVVANNLTYGHGTLRKRWAQWEQEGAP